MRRRFYRRSSVANAAAGTGTPVVKLNEDKGGIEIHFPTKPSGAVLDMLRTAGWHWSSYNACWYAANTPDNQNFAYRIMAMVAADPLGVVAAQPVAPPPPPVAPPPPPKPVSVRQFSVTDLDDLNVPELLKLKTTLNLAIEAAMRSRQQTMMVA